MEAIKNSNTLIYKIFDFDLKINKPLWWDEVLIEQEITIENFLLIIRNLVYPKEWQKKFKAYYFYGQLKNEIPYTWAHTCLQDQVEEHELAIEIFLGIAKYLKANQPNESLSKIYKDMGYSYHELGKIDLAIEHYKKSTEEINDVKSAEKYYADLALKAMLELTQIKNKIEYANSLIDFNENIVKRSLEFENNKTLKNHKQNELTGFMSLEEPKNLTNFQLAFLELIHIDIKLTNPKIFSEKLISEVKKQFQEYHNNQKLNFKIIPSQLTYPTKKSNKWSLHFDGENFEIVSVNFNRWKIIRINLSD